MTVEELRRKLIARIDALLARPLLIWGEDRALLSAVRGYAAGMSAVELEKVLTFYNYQGSPPLGTLYLRQRIETVLHEEFSKPAPGPAYERTADRIMAEIKEIMGPETE